MTRYQKSIRSVLAFILFLVLIPQAKASSSQQILVGVRGMVCAFCASGLKKTFTAQNGIEKVEVSLEKKQLVLQVDSATMLSDQKIRELVRDSGYEVENIQRPSSGL